MPEQGSALLEVTGLAKSFGGVRAVVDCNLTVRAGTAVGLIGPNGAGKSTAIEVISGFLKPDAGRITFDGTQIEGWPPHRVASRGLLRTFQTPREWAGLTVSTFEGDADNVKLTTDEDFARAEAARLARLSDVRTGFGFDVHPFGDGDHVTLGGVRISHARGLVGHSDADVVLHALVDAILGALGEGDIGVHFPPTDPQWRGASSDRFLTFAVERVHARAGRIAHLDVTVVCEAPRIGPHRDAMRKRIAEIAGVPVTRIGLKATTSEKMGFTGRGEGMAAFATATVRLPWSE